ncbi:MAG: putative aliphatic sulfonates transport permease protein SsuC [Alphaproteobacteria bacterium MarineAlpha5_Bin11]|nr:ABC transporter permease [Pelagibacteraceae bacterium]PPR42244.1 MAG: putative aliphatic sulfonates transport permease protein SsuC [Alphaproteobacteria bacterium MarineAlpha5_Bin11]PPR51363.1 MAG: putative aliphatic sulfonates transport permease protein SsuC [Alphaproteobacteria bacterium MarineAlpha5_Bin10]|tara:strand:+ start:114 stop:872 length:759 start_codon:yes stop_codon:yes gene_type:complete
MNKNNSLPKLYRWASFLCIILIWTILSFLIEHRLFASPLSVLNDIWYHLAEGELIDDTLITLARAGTSFAIAMILGSIIGYLLARIKKLDYFFDSWVIIGLNIPAIVLVILFYIWLGLNEIALISAVVLNKIPIVIVNIREGTKSMDKSYFQIAKVYQLNNFQIWRKIILPQLYPYLMTSARTGLSLIWKIVLVFELLGRGSGIGFQLQVFFQFFDISSLLAYSIFFMSIILLIENYIMIPIEKKATHWRKL